jgi:Ca2+/Na+ antiporter
MNRLKEKLQLAAMVLLIVALLLGIGSCTRWKWNECRGVGHGALYCIHMMGSKR